jgi:hypothetical protein
MMATQSHHAKLWLAANARNWELAEYQVDELKEGLEDAAKHIPDYKGVPVGSMIESLMLPPIVEVESAIKARDRQNLPSPSTKPQLPATPVTSGRTGASSLYSGRQPRHFPISPLHQNESKNSPIVDRNVAAFNPAEIRATD